MSLDSHHGITQIVLKSPSKGNIGKRTLNVTLIGS